MKIKLFIPERIKVGGCYIKVVGCYMKRHKSIKSIHGLAEWSSLALPVAEILEMLLASLAMVNAACFIHLSTDITDR